MNWCRHTASQEVTHLTRQLADGLVLCHIVHHYKPNLFDLETARGKSPRERLEFVFRVCETHFGVARILDPEDVHTLASDKKAVMTYVMCMLEAMPHDLKLLHGDQEGLDVETVNLGSPLKSNAKLKSGKTH